MTAYLMNDDILQGKRLPADTIELTNEQLETAVAISDRATGEANQWQAYLNALALFGVQQWFRERSPQLSLRSEWLQPRIPAGNTVQPAAIATLEVEQFQLFLVAAEDLDDEIAVPRSIVDSGVNSSVNSNQPQFSLLVQVLEELAQVRITRSLRQDQLCRYQTINSLVTEDDLYLLPIGWFEVAPGELLLYLQYLEPAAFSVPAAVSRSIANHLQPVIQTTVNTAFLLQSQVEQIATEFAWILLPPATSSAMRSLCSPADQLDLVMSQLIIRDPRIRLPPQIGNAYQDIVLANETLRLYAVNWNAANNEWMLLILGTPSGTPLPAGLQFQLRDETQTLMDQVATERMQHNFLYAQIRGEIGENFYVTLTLSEQTIALPPLTFFPNAEP